MSAQKKISLALPVILIVVLGHIPALAQQLPGVAKVDSVREATAYWSAPGEGAQVDRYRFEMKVNDGDFNLLADNIPGDRPTYTFTVNCGDTIIVRVAGISATGAQGPFSLPSEPWYADCEGDRPGDLGPPGPPGKPQPLR